MDFLRALWASDAVRKALWALGGALALVSAQYFGISPL